MTRIIPNVFSILLLLAFGLASGHEFERAVSLHDRAQAIDSSESWYLLTVEIAAIHSAIERQNYTQALNRYRTAVQLLRVFRSESDFEVAIRDCQFTKLLTKYRRQIDAKL